MRRKENENEDNINEKGFHSVLAWVDRPPRWHCQLVYGILGMRDDSKYGKILRRTVGSCFAFLMLLLAIAAGWDFCRTACYRLEVNKHFDGSYYDTQYISRNVTYYTYYDEDGFLKTADGKKTITGIRWIAKPLGMDSLICYSDGKKRGYFNMFTGKPVIEPKYSHAWIFSDGLALVDDGIKFIDASGKVVIDPQIPYIPGAEGYVFHKNRCIVHNERRDRFGLLDKQGKWVLQPEYFSTRIFWESKRTSKGIAVEKMPFLKDKKLVIPTKDLFPCAPERFSNMIDNNFCVRLKKQELTEEEYIEQKEEYLKTGDAKIIIYALNVRHSDAIHLEEMQVMTEETRQQNDGKLFKKLPLLCEQIGIGTLTVSEYLHRNGFFIDK